jgi:hypothetical protein
MRAIPLLLALTGCATTNAKPDAINWMDMITVTVEQSSPAVVAPQPVHVPSLHFQCVLFTPVMEN